ncbi:MAG: response regulator [Bdellovibrionales bacterium]|nr:response regulator [Bdellovibrionales bacterium]
MSKILIAEDTAAFRAPIVLLLERQGHTVFCVETGEQALAAIFETSPELVLLDAAMPKLDGFAVLQELGAQGLLPELPVIMLTAVSDRAYESRARSLGVREYLIKSYFSLPELLQHIEKHLP